MNAKRKIKFDLQENPLFSHFKFSTLIIQREKTLATFLFIAKPQVYY